MRVKQPTSEQCSKNDVLPSEDGWVSFAAWHPQWGGYASHCRVTFGQCGVNQCFDVSNWHDGEFVRDEEPDEKHYCDASQLVEFGLLVLEKQAEHRAPAASGKRAVPDPMWIEATIARLNALKKTAP